MSLSENTRLELMRMTLNFAAGNFVISKNGPETSRDISASYRILLEALTHDECSNRSVTSNSFFLFPSRISKRAFLLLRRVNKRVCTVEEMLRRVLRILSAQEVSQCNDGLHSVVNRHGHSSSPVDSKKTAPDSTSEAAEKSVAQPAFELSVEELLQINRGFIPEALKIRALNELQRRAGEREASS